MNVTTTVTSPLTLWPRPPLPEPDVLDVDLPDDEMARVFADGGLAVDVAELPAFAALTEPVGSAFDSALPKRQAARIRIKPLADTASWDERGTCHVEGWSADVFYPTRHSSRADIALARSICSRCPVRVDCLAHSLTLKERGGGIWGGETADERRTTRREWKTAARLKPGLNVLVWTREHLRRSASRGVRREGLDANPV